MPFHGITYSAAFLSALPGGGELLLLFLVILILFGPRRLPEFARSIGRILAELRRAADDFKAQLLSAEHLIDEQDMSISDKPDSGKKRNNDLST